MGSPVMALNTEVFARAVGGPMMMANLSAFDRHADAVDRRQITEAGSGESSWSSGIRQNQWSWRIAVMQFGLDALFRRQQALGHQAHHQDQARCRRA
jgi:hypothetical protein